MSLKDQIDQCLDKLKAKGLYLTDMGLTESETRELADSCDEQSFRDLVERIEQLWQTRSSFNEYSTSYGMKHIYSAVFEQYVTNGKFILAMLLNGFRLKRDGQRSPNVFFNYKPKYKFDYENNKLIVFKEYEMPL